MDTSIQLHTADSRPYNVTMRADTISVETMGESLPRKMTGTVAFSVDVAHFDDLARMVAALSPGVTPDELRDALRADAVAVIDAMR